MTFLFGVCDWKALLHKGKKEFNKKLWKCKEYIGEMPNYTDIVLFLQFHYTLFCPLTTKNANDIMTMNSGEEESSNLGFIS